ncbi:MAG TPA: glycoside hydrolase family 3 N-terminal domain-containing protein [Kineosporiaceae bacterium]|nr:glycoside hydrolase family 3 N-terminal domain-containing protein [Kineosporiaceae bacterium]
MRGVRVLIAVASAATLLAAGCGGQPRGGATGGPAGTSSAAPASPSATATTPGTAPPATSSPVPAPATQGTRGSTGAPTAVAANACVDTTLARLSPERRAAQVLLVGVSATSPASDAGALVAIGVGGIFLHGRVAGGPSVQDALGTVQRTARRAGTLPVFVAADEEGGAVQTVTGGTIPPFPSARVQGTWLTSALRSRTARWGAELARLGVNLDLAPVADTVPVALGTANPPIGRYGREYGTTPAAVSRAVAVVVPALAGVRVGSTVKHFPGLGRVLANTDTSADAVDATTTATDPYLRPFSAGMQAGALAVMVSSARYPRLDARNPAMWSSAVVTGLLRGRLGWHGLVVSDDLGLAVAARSRPVGARAVSFLGAGGDLVLTVQPGQAATMRAAILAQAAARTSWRSRLDDAVRHVLAAKQALGLLSC